MQLQNHQTKKLRNQSASNSSGREDAVKTSTKGKVLFLKAQLYNKGLKSGYLRCKTIIVS